MVEMLGAEGVKRPGTAQGKDKRALGSLGHASAYNVQHKFEVGIADSQPAGFEADRQAQLDKDEARQIPEQGLAHPLL